MKSTLPTTSQLPSARHEACVPALNNPPVRGAEPGRTSDRNSSRDVINSTKYFIKDDDAICADNEAFGSIPGLEIYMLVSLVEQEWCLMGT